MKSCSRHRRSGKSQKGAALVETALVLTTLLSMILFIMDMGRVLLIQQYITERARTTVRSAVVNNWSTDDARNFLIFNNTTAPEGGGSGFLGLLPSQVSSQTLGTVGEPNHRLQITVSNVPAVVFTPYLNGSFTLPPIVATMPVQSLGATN